MEKNFIEFMMNKYCLKTDSDIEQFNFDTVKVQFDEFHTTMERTDENRMGE